MESFVEFFIKNVTTDKVWIAFLALAVYYVLKKEPFKIFEHFSARKDKEHQLAKELLDSGKLGKEANEFLRDHLERHAFRHYLGINADADMRNALVKFQRKHQRAIGWSAIRRAYPNLTLNGSKIEAQLGVLDHVLRWVVTALSWVTGLYALFVIAFAIYAMQQLSRVHFFGLTFAALALLLGAVLFSSMNWPYHNTRSIAELSRKEQ